MSSFSRLSRSHSDTPHSVEFLRRNDQPDKRSIPDNTQHSQERDIHSTGGIRTRNPSKLATADPRLRPRGHWHRRSIIYHMKLQDDPPPNRNYKQGFSEYELKIIPTA